MGNEVSSPERGRKCSIHTADAPHAQCRRCNDTPYASLTSTRSPSIEVVRRCPYHIIGRPHPHCEHCNESHLSSAVPAGTSTLPPGSCQVHTIPNAHCQRCTDSPLAGSLPLTTPVSGASKKCSMHSALNAPHPLCEQCNSLCTIAISSETLYTSTWTTATCNVHSRRNPMFQCRACNAAAFRELMMAGAVDPEMIRLSSQRRCTLHDAGTPDLHCQACNDIALVNLIQLNTPQTDNTSAAPSPTDTLNRPATARTCNRHNAAAPNSNCQTCNPAILRPPQRTLPVRDSLDEPPPPAYQDAHADRVLASAHRPIPSIRAPSYTYTYVLPHRVEAADRVSLSPDDANDTNEHAVPRSSSDGPSPTHAAAYDHHGISQEALGRYHGQHIHMNGLSAGL